MSKTSVHLEPVYLEGALRPLLIGRVYYGGGSFEQLTPFDAVFVVILQGGGRAYGMAAHGKITPRAYGLAARLLLRDWGVALTGMKRHGRQIEVDNDRASDFGGLDD